MPPITRSEKALSVPGVLRITRSISRPRRSRTSRSGPAILMPTGVLMPVASMSSRVLIGIVQAFVSPGTCTASCNSETSRSGVMPGLHWSGGLSLMVDSIIESGAGSVAVSARPALPKTCSTSGNVMMILFVC